MFIKLKNLMPLAEKQKISTEIQHQNQYSLLW